MHAFHLHKVIKYKFISPITLLKIFKIMDASNFYRKRSDRKHNTVFSKKEAGTFVAAI
jgi:hypothetical protein